MRFMVDGKEYLNMTSKSKTIHVVTRRANFQLETFAILNDLCHRPTSLSNRSHFSQSASYFLMNVCFKINYILIRSALLLIPWAITRAEPKIVLMSFLRVAGVVWHFLLDDCLSVIKSTSSELWDEIMLTRAKWIFFSGKLDYVRGFKIFTSLIFKA